MLEKVLSRKGKNEEGLFGLEDRASVKRPTKRLTRR